MRPRGFDQSNFFNLNDVLLRCVLREQPCSEANVDGSDIFGSESVIFATTPLQVGSPGKGKTTQ
jgi:hypothetical protein